MCSEAQELDQLLMEGEEGQGQRSVGNPVPPSRLKGRRSNLPGIYSRRTRQKRHCWNLAIDFLTRKAGAAGRGSLGKQTRGASAPAGI